MPNISFIQRKPKPLGSEFKSFTDGVLKVMLHMELQEGKIRMAKKAHFRNLGATASCVMRAVDAGRKFSTFNESSFFRTGVHDDEPMPKDPPSDSESSTSSSDSSTADERLSQKPPAVNLDHLSQMAQAEEDQKVSTNVLNV